VAGKELALLELPLTVMDGSLFWQLNLGPVEACDRTLALLGTVRRVAGLAVLLWHQRVWHEKRYPGWHQVYGRALEYLRKDGRAWVATAGQVADWWLAREALRLESVSLVGPMYQWHYRAGRPMEGVVLSLQHVGSGDVSVLGVEAAISTEGNGLRLALEPLAAGHSFGIRWASEVEAV
jgi:hypothetical protein